MNKQIDYILVRTSNVLFHSEIDSECEAFYKKGLLSKINNENLTQHSTCNGKGEIVAAASNNEEDQLEIYNELIHLCIEEIQNLLNNPAIRCSIALTASDIYTRLLQFNENKNDNRYNKNDRKFIRALVRYCSRAKYKTSPFARYTVTNLVKVTDEKTSVIPAKSSSIFSPNVDLFKKCYDLQGDSNSIPEVVAINPTITVDSAKQSLLWLVNMANVDVVHRSSMDPLLLSALNIIDSKKTWNSSDLHLAIMNCFYFTYDKAETIINSLFKSGLIIESVYVSANASSIVDYYKKKAASSGFVLSQLNEVYSERFKKITVALLNDDAESVHGIERAIKEDVLELQKKASKKLMLDSLVGTGNDEKKDNESQVRSILVGYEDRFDEREIQIDLIQAYNQADDLLCMLPVLARYDWYAFEHDLLSAIIKTSYGDKAPIPLLECFETYEKVRMQFSKICKSNRLNHLQYNRVSLQSEESNLLNSVESQEGHRKDFRLDGLFQLVEMYNGIDKVVDDWAVDLCNVNVGGRSVVLTHEDFNTLRKRIDEKRLLHWFQDGEKLHGSFYFQSLEDIENIHILNATTQGLFKRYGRFLNGYDDELKYSWRNNIEGEYKDVKVSTFIDKTTFNANLENDFLRYYIPSPESWQPQIDDVVMLDVPNLFVENNMNRARLYDLSDGVEVFCLDVGMELITQRSKWAKFITLFSPMVSPDHRQITEPITSAFLKKNIGEPVIAIPRIMLGSHWILQRKRWYVDHQQFSIGNCSTRSEFLNAVEAKKFIKEWRELGLPEEAFIKPLNSSDSSVQYRLYDHHKPQYCNIWNPLGLDMLRQTISRARPYLLVEEALPNSRISNYVYAQEYVCQKKAAYVI
ncbi:MAG: hypothetical protein R3F28_00015 [Candidatus Kapaibacterium sp.]